MNFLTIENASKSYGEKVLFDKISLHIAKGQKIALVAKNGSGKTTLLRVIAGEEAVEGENAHFLLNKNVRVGFLKQEPFFSPSDTVLEAALDIDNEQVKAIKNYELALLKDDQDKIHTTLAKVEDLKAWNIESKIKEILGKLNLHNLAQTVNTLSGGQKKRLALAKLLIEAPDFLILDEPTNHLDIDMIEWLEGYLQTASLTLFMVTHDRYFLERVCTEIVELDQGNLYLYKGNYTDYLIKRTARILNENTVLEKTKKLFKKELTWINRQPKARGTKAKSRVDKFDGIKQAAHKKRDDSLLDIQIQPQRLGSKILEAHDVSLSFGDLDIVKNFSYKIKKGEKIGVAGPNGVGKTSFIKLLVGDNKPTLGKIVKGETVVFGHYAQDGLQLTEDKRVIDVIRDIAEFLPLQNGSKLTAPQLLERFLFPRPQQQVFVSQLSGGEKRRLHLLAVLMDNPNFLILDEPTNDLDIITLNILEEYLESFAGCVLIVSHDRYFMDKIVDHLFVLEGEGRVKDFNGTYSEYKRSYNQEKYTATAEQKKQKSIEEATPAVEEEKKRSLTYFEQKEYKKLDGDIENLEKEKTSISEKFNDPGLSNDDIVALSVKLGEIKNQLEEKENRWLELSEWA